MIDRAMYDEAGGVMIVAAGGRNAYSEHPHKFKC